MTELNALPETDPRHHTLKIKAMLNDTLQHLRDDVTKVTDPKAQALFETSAEVLQGLLTAYDHFEQRSEPAWR
ncbi:hypothetical protein K2O51_11580 [Cupriavidus pinatubonensis]|uniref:hypothetical protein n=1 Tax=Cupriavidus pinatubonensis TaxID=248026 RepID=UPI0011282925|nr:hypothetical protein [Cupriavidus pinatubonensis]QYY28508.1 hypothetical protein K2O51_11580 [Cupriavidus pinatubonensis]TPQ38038.1 hypothetical protein C2U69_14745 [Cupriavidus pinatubonensis]